MIDVKELRIGAHVSLRGERVTIFQTLHTGLVEVLRFNKESEVCTTDILDPIPLTAGLLREIGFEPVRKTLGRPDEEWYIEPDGYPIRVMKGYSDNPEREWSVHIDSWDYDTIGSADVAYLHQLEGIVYLCTGEELIKEDWL